MKNPATGSTSCFLLGQYCALTQTCMGDMGLIGPLRKVPSVLTRSFQTQPQAQCCSVVQIHVHEPPNGYEAGSHGHVFLKALDFGGQDQALLLLIVRGHEFIYYKPY